MLVQRKNLPWLPTILGDFINSEIESRFREKAPLNIYDSEDKFLVEIAAPGVTKEMVDISLQGENQLLVKIQSENCQRTKPETGKYLRKEFCCYEIEQTLMLPDNVDKEAITAKTADGILCITIPKRSKEVIESLTKRIAVE